MVPDNFNRHIKYRQIIVKQFVRLIFRFQAQKGSLVRFRFGFGRKGYCVFRRFLFFARKHKIIYGRPLILENYFN